MPISYKFKRNGIELSSHISNQHYHSPNAPVDGQLLAINTEHYQIHLETNQAAQQQQKQTTNTLQSQLQAKSGLKDGANQISGGALEETRYWLTLSIGAVGRTDTGVFTCLASNKFGSAEKNYRLIVQEKPDPPSTLLVQRITAASLTLTWTAPFNGNSALLEYRIQCRESGQPWTRPTLGLAGEQQQSNTSITNNITGCGEYRRSSLESSLTIQNLSSSSSYELRMSARNALGESEFSDQIHVQTLEEGKCSLSIFAEQRKPFIDPPGYAVTSDNRFWERVALKDAPLVQHGFGFGLEREKDACHRLDGTHERVNKGEGLMAYELSHLLWG